MDKKWAELTPREKREERFKRWLKPANVKFSGPEAKKAYQERVTRFIKVIQLQEPDRVPVMLPTGFLPAYYAGGTLHSVMYDYARLQEAWEKYLDEFEMDSFDSPALVYPGKVLDMIDYKMFKWPGHGLPADNTSYQYVEKEYMAVDEYDAFIHNPADFLWRSFLPRVVGAFQPFQRLAPITPLIGMPIPYIMPFGRQDVRGAYRTLLAAGRETAKWQRVLAKCTRKAREKGIPPIRGGGISQAPFDMIGDTLRGTQGVIMDMFRRPEKLIEAMEALTPMLIDVAVASSNATGCPVIFIPLHKGDDCFMSDQQYERFYWPTFKKALLGLINEGLVPMPFAEGRYTERLKTIWDLPAGTTIWWFDQTDMVKAKEILGDIACIAGNVPASLLFTGTPRAVKEYCRRLIEVAGKGGGFILTGGVGMDKGNPDNLRAMMNAAKEYGVYQK